MKAPLLIVSLGIKPLSVNECWQGKRFKTKTYQAYERLLLLSMPALEVPDPPYRIEFVFGMSNVQSDWDNPVKPLQDIMQKKYGFNDRDIYEASVKKVKVEKGKEYFSVRLESLIPA